MRQVSKIFLLFLVYFVTAKIGLSLGAVNHFATPVWPPTGISLAALLIFGHKLWPGIFLGALLVNLISGAPPFVSLGIAAGNTLEALIAVWILNKVGFRISLERLKDSLYLIFGAAIFSTLISSIIGAASLYLGGVIKVTAIKETWFTWWVGDMLGNLVVAPLLLAWFRRPKYRGDLTHTLEVILVFLILALSGSIVFRGFLGISSISLPITYMVIPPLIWISVRFSQRASATAIFGLSLIAIWGTIEGYGIFANPNLSHSLLTLEGFLGVHAITFLILSSLIAERKELERKKDEFIGIASHELKTPITTLKAYIQLLGNPPLSSAKFSEYLPRINREIDRLIKLVSDLLDFNQVRTEKMQFQLEPFFIDELIDTVVKDIQVNSRREIIYKKNKTVQISLTADKYRIEQVLINLLLNAVKFSPNGKGVYVSILKHKQFVRVNVKDHGIGIAQKYHKEIFTKFFQAKEKSKEAYSGLGLGLFISSEIIKQHGGEIWVESKEGKGSTFCFKLPLSERI
jgi:signal transduction histidine kinase